MQAIYKSGICITVQIYLLRVKTVITLCVIVLIHREKDCWQITSYLSHLLLKIILPHVAVAKLRNLESALSLAADLNTVFI